MKDLINKFREQMKKNKGEVYPIEGHTLLQKDVDEYTKETYLKMLCVIMRYDGQGSEEQATFIKRLIKGIGGQGSFEEYLRKAMEVDIKFFDEALKQIKENELKYIFTIDSILITYIASNVTDEQISFVAELSEMVGISKDEMELISKIVRTVLEQDNKGYLEICKSIETIQEKEKILVPFYPYAKQFVGGVIKEVGKCDMEDDYDEYFFDEYNEDNKSIYYLDYPKIRDIIEFGKFKWRVLDVKKDRMFLISDSFVSKRSFDEDSQNYLYEKSDIREWLNGKFINNNFDDFEQKRIILTELEDIKIKDKVFLLSENEVKKYFKSDKDREVDDHKYQFDNDWILRDNSSGYSKNRVACVCCGRICTDYFKGALDINKANYIRPGMWVSL